MITDELRSKLIQEAAKVRLLAYAPYSNYKVGAALYTQKENIFTGVNVENAAYPTTICAERSAIFTAVSSGEQKFIAIAVVTEDGGSPCGSCRQVLAEFGGDIVVIVADTNGKVHIEDSVANLLPGYFGPANLLE